MNRLPIEKRIQILRCLTEGMSLRATTRAVGVSLGTVTKLLGDVGAACDLYQNETLGKLNCKRLQVEEIWTFVGVYTSVAIDVDTKLVARWRVGTRSIQPKVQNHARAVALHYMFYNFAKIHKTLRATPAMQARIADHVWTLAEIAALPQSELS